MRGLSKERLFSDGYFKMATGGCTEQTPGERVEPGDALENNAVLQLRKDGSRDEVVADGV